MRALLVRDETGRLTNRLVPDLEGDEFRVNSLSELDAADLDGVREFIVLSHDGRGPRHGEMVPDWKPLTARGFTGCYRGDLVLEGGLKYREQHWKRAGRE